MADSRFGESRLLEHLKRINMTPAEYARRMKISRAFVSKLISGERNLSLLRARRTARMFDCHIDDLYTWRD